MKITARIRGCTFAVSVICSVIAYGGISGKAVAADFEPSTTAEQYNILAKRAAIASGVLLDSVRVWTTGNSAEYERFWSAFEYTHNFYITSEDWMPRSFTPEGEGEGEGDGGD